MSTKLNTDYRMLDSTSFLFELYQKETQAYGNYDTHHWHNEPEIIRCIEGEVKVTVDGQFYTLKPNDLFFINSSKVHAVHILPFSKCDVIVFELNCYTSQQVDECDRMFLLPLKKLEMAVDSFTAFSQANEQQKAEQNALFIKIVEAYHTPPVCYQMLVKCYLFQLFASFIGVGGFITFDGEQNSEYSLHYKLLKETLKFIDRNFTEKITLEELALHANMSVSYLCKIFKKYTGYTIVDYLNMVRIERASSLVANTDKNIIEIAFQVGFQNFSYFSKKFKEYKGSTPSDYRKTNKNQNSK